MARGSGGALKLQPPNEPGDFMTVENSCGDNVFILLCDHGTCSVTSHITRKQQP